MYYNNLFTNKMSRRYPGDTFKISLKNINVFLITFLASFEFIQSNIFEKKTLIIIFVS